MRAIFHKISSVLLCAALALSAVPVQAAAVVRAHVAPAPISSLAIPSAPMAMISGAPLAATAMVMPSAIGPTPITALPTLPASPLAIPAKAVAETAPPAQPNLEAGANVSGAQFDGSALPTRLIVGPGTFWLGNPHSLDQKELDGRLAAAASDGERALVKAAYATNDSYEARRILVEEAGKQADHDRIKAFISGFSRIARDHFRSTLAKHGHTVIELGGFAVYEIQNGLAFWSDLLTTRSAEKRAAGLQLLNSQLRGPLDDKPALVIGNIVSRQENTTQLIEARRLDDTALAGLARLTEQRRVLADQVDGRIVVGGGSSFHLTRGLLSAAHAIKDSILAGKMARLLRFLAATSIGILHGQLQGAAAYYDPGFDQLAYVMPGSGDLNSISHEATHARFKRFEDHLVAWAKAKGYAVPYEVDGPKVDSGNFGSFMNLLNELNSWRVGESFDGKDSDDYILAILRRSYGAQAGWGNVRTFSRLWSQAAVHGRSVPQLILNSFHRLNALDQAGMIVLGERALAEHDPIAGQDFLRLLAARRPGLKDLTADEARLLAALTVKDSKTTAARDEDAEVEAGVLSVLGPGHSEAKVESAFLDLLERAIRKDPPGTSEQQDLALYTLEEVFERAGRPLLNPGSEHKARRDRLSRLLTPKVDRFLAEHLLDGKPEMHRLGLLNIIRTRTSPKELPKLNSRVLEAVSAREKKASVKNDRQLARLFLAPDTEEKPPLAWAESVADHVRQAPSAPAGLLEFVCDYYRLALAKALPGSPWGVRPGVHLDAETKDHARRTLVHIAPALRPLYENAVDHLWLLMGHKKAAVRIAARYAAASHPAYLLALEDRMIETFKGPPSPRREGVAALLSMVEEGFLPALDAELAGTFQPTQAEAELLALRLGQRDPWRGHENKGPKQ